MESEDFGVAEPEEVEAAESDVRTVGETLAVMVAEEVMDVVREATADAVDEHTGSYQRPSMLHDTIWSSMLLSLTRHVQRVGTSTPGRQKLPRGHLPAATG
jgi:hypothetical protein